MRSEFKYPIRRCDIPALRAELEPWLLRDANAVADENGMYTVRSLYYDTRTLKYYQEKEDGIAKRRKVRIRVYNDREPDSVAFLEVKHKDQQWVSKSRAPIRVDHVEHFLAGGEPSRYLLALDAHPKAAQHATHFLYYMRSARLQPSALIVYHRIAFEGRYDRSFRLTFDFDLRAAMRMELADLYSDDNLVPFFNDLCVVEVKFTRSMPTFVAAALSRYDARRDTVSKYCLGIDAARFRRRSPMP